MKMLCPQCGVKGSVPDALLGKRVRCPKCKGIFAASVDLVEAIPMEEVELVEVEQDMAADLGLSSEKEIDEVFSKLLGAEEPTAAPAAPLPEDSFSQNAAEEFEDEMSAALADLDEEQKDGEQWLEEGAEQWSEDDTLTIIEDIPDESAAAAEDKEGEPLLADEFEDKAEREEVDLDFLEPVPEKEPVSGEQPVVEEEEGGEQPAAIEMAGTDAAREEAPLAAEVGEELEASLGGTEQEDVAVGVTGAAADEQPAAAAAEPEAAGEREETEELEETADEDAAGETQAVIQKCAACGEYVDHDDKHEFDGNVYCGTCIPTELKSELARAAALADREAGAAGGIEAEPGRFTVVTLIKDAWYYAKGAKGAIWGGILIMYLLLFAVGVAVAVATPFFAGVLSPAQSALVEAVLQSGMSALSFVFTAGIILIALHRIGRKSYSWKMVFSGFRKFWALIGLLILQTIMVVIGFVLFILPGIYLTVGYMLAIPLLMDKGYSPWQALESSRKAVHKRWWTVFFSLVVMGILLTLSSIPLGIGLIWTVPMFVVLVGVLYYHFFGADE